MPEYTDYVLWYQKGDGTLQEVPVTKTLTVGSIAGCDLVISDPQIAPKSFTLQEDAGRLSLVGLSSEVPLILKGNNLAPGVPVELNLDEVFTIGEYTFFVRISAPASFMSINIPKEDMTEKAPRTSRVEPAISQVKLEMLQKGRWKIFAAVFAGMFLIAMITSWFLFIKPALNPPEIEGTETPSQIVEVESSDTAVVIVDETPVLTPSFAVEETTSSQVAAELTITPPGLGVINFSTISIDPESINVSDLLNLQLSLESLLSMGLEVAGKNVGYVYRYSGISENGKLRTIELSYIKSEVDKVVEGVTYPDWGDEPIPVDIEWQPTVYTLEDGSGSYPVFIAETSYKTTEDASVYYTNGIYQAAGSTEKYNSSMYFDKDGNMLKLLVFTSGDGIAQLPREVAPAEGDQFTLLLREFVFEEKHEGTAELAESSGVEIPAELQVILEVYGNEFLPVVSGKGKFVEYEGSKFTFGSQPIRFTKTVGTTGDYVVGVAVEDMDGNYYIIYIPVEVVEKYVNR